ncbi:MAG: DUF2271 domain-containing protein [Hyphomonadaceae bacterium]
MIVDPSALPAALPAIETPYGAPRPWRFHDAAILGTRMNLIVHTANGNDAMAAAHAARNEIDRLNRLFNTRDATSELSVLNRSASLSASPDLFEALASAEAWRTKTGGAFSPRQGRAIDAWRTATAGPPSRDHLRELAAEAEQARVEMDAETRTIVRPGALSFALDGFAKGWIADAALGAMLRSSAVLGGLVEIGGDIACGGVAPEDGWLVAIPDARLPFDNAPAATYVALAAGGVATSGFGPRDRRIGERRYSETLSPADGWPVEHMLSASAFAASAADAEALATAGMVMGSDDALGLASSLAGAGLRLTEPGGSVRALGAWRSAGPLQPTLVQSTEPGRWHDRWQTLVTFTAPRRQLVRDPGFRSPYMAMWITDERNRPVRTLLLVGTKDAWHKDNYIWWRQNKAKTGKLMATRSMATSGSGVYNVFWDGVDDEGRSVAAATYVLHVETSRERGKHTYRSMTLDFTQPKRFRYVLPATEEGGGLTVSFDHF